MSPRIKNLILGVFFLAGGRLLAAEGDAHAAFLNQYGSSNPEERKAAIAKLAGSTDKVAWQQLQKIATNDAAPDVRQAAFDTLNGCKDVDGFLAQLLAQVFKNEKDKEIKLATIKALSRQEFKSAILQELVNFITTQRYPELYDNNKGGGGGGSGAGAAPNSGISGMGSSAGSSGGGIAGASGQGNSRAASQKTREYFESILEQLNSYAGTHFKAKKDSPEEVKRWWASKSFEYQKKDQELADKINADALKLAAQAQAPAAPKNPNAAANQPLPPNQPKN